MLRKSNKKEPHMDRRLFHRLPCHYQVEVKDASSDSFLTTQGCDFSSTGLGAIAKKHFNVGTEVELKIKFSNKHAPLYTRATVQWVKPKLWRKWRIGFEFFPLDLGKFMPLFAYR